MSHCGLPGNCLIGAQCLPFNWGNAGHGSANKYMHQKSLLHRKTTCICIRFWCIFLAGASLLLLVCCFWVTMGIQKKNFVKNHVPSFHQHAHKLGHFMAFLILDPFWTAAIAVHLHPSDLRSRRWRNDWREAQAPPRTSGTHLRNDLQRWCVHLLTFRSSPHRPKLGRGFFEAASAEARPVVDDVESYSYT